MSRSNRSSSIFNKSNCSHRFYYGKGYRHTRLRDKKLVNTSIMVGAQLDCVIIAGFYTYNDGPAVAQHGCMAGASSEIIH